MQSIDLISCMCPFPLSRFWAISAGVAFLHVLIIFLLSVKLEPARLGALDRAKVSIITLQLLPFIESPPRRRNAQDAFQPAERTREKARGKAMTATDGGAIAAAPASNPAPAAQSAGVHGANESSGSIAPLDLSLSKRLFADDRANRRPIEELGLQSNASGSWAQFAKALEPVGELREVRLADNRLRVHTKHGCFELSESATKRIDPFGRTQEFVEPCGK